MTDYTGSDDVRMAARVQVVESGRLMTETCRMLADRRYPLLSNLWTALSCWPAAAANVVQALGHPTFEDVLAEACDFAERATLMLRAIEARMSGDEERAGEYACLAGATMPAEEER